jgi:hypothetical protein
MALGAAALLACLGGCATLNDAADLARDALEPATPGVKPLDAAHAAALSDEQIEQRLAFVTRRLDANRRHAQGWQYGSFAVNAGGMAVEAAFAATEEGSDRDFAIIESGKALIGTIYVLAAPLPGRNGAEPVREMPSTTHDERAAQLAEAEAILYAANGRAHQRKGWLLHTGNVAVNAAGAVPLLAEKSYGNAALSFFLDTAVGEAEILLTPWQPETDWREYQDFVARGGLPSEPRARWQLRPNGEGLAVELDF